MSFRSALRVGSKLRFPGHRNVFVGTRYNSTLAHDIFAQEKIEEFSRTFSKSKTKCSDIHEHYPGLVSTIRWSLANEPSLSIYSPPQSYVDQVELMVETLASSATPADIETLNNLLNDLPEIFLMRPTPEIHTRIIRTFLAHKKVHAAIKWLQDMSTKPGGVFPTLEQYHLILDVVKDTETPKFMRSIIRSMRGSGCKPSHETYSLLICAIWSHYDNLPTRPSLLTFEDIIADMKENGLHTHKYIADLLYDEYASRGFMSDARKVLENYIASAPSSWLTPTKEREIRWTDEVSAVALTQDLDATLIKFQELKEKEGALASRQILKAILRGTSTLEDLKRAEKSVGVTASVVHWSLVLSNAVRQGQLLRARQIYEASKEAGIVPDAPLVGPLIKALCDLKHYDSFVSAMTIYDDLVAASPPTAYIPKQSIRDRAVGPDPDIYHHIFRAISHLTKEIPDILNLCDLLMDEMHQRSIPLSCVSASFVVIRMRVSETEADAMDAYEKSKADLTSEGYLHVLSAFVGLNFGQAEHNPSLVNYFRIANDMKAAGYPPMKEKVFSTLLHHLSRLATIMTKHTRVSPDFFQAVTISVRRVHDLISLEAALDPDAALLNQLMDLYSRLGCFGDAYRLWEQMALSGRYDHASVSIAFDVCGFSGSIHAYRQVRIRLAQEKFKLNKGNWDSLVECMCRLRMVNDAAKLVCIEMPGEGVQPDSKTVSPLLTVVRGNQEVSDALKGRIKQHLPTLWESLPNNLTSSENI